MRTDDPPHSWGVPDFGAVSQRSCLIRLIETHRPGLTLIVAPSGYGKSVLPPSTCVVRQWRAGCGLTPLARPVRGLCASSGRGGVRWAKRRR